MFLNIKDVDVIYFMIGLVEYIVFLLGSYEYFLIECFIRGY